MGQRLGQTRFGVYTDAILLQAARSVFLLPWVQNLRRYIQRIRLCVSLLEIELAFRCFDKMHSHLSFAESVF